MSDIDDVLQEAWEVSQSGDYVMAPGDYTVCWVGWTSPAELVRAKARARIIAAAPALYRALDTLLDSIAEGIPPDSMEIDNAEDVLAALRDGDE